MVCELESGVETGEYSEDRKVLRPVRLEHATHFIALATKFTDFDFLLKLPSFSRRGRGGFCDYL